MILYEVNLDYEKQTGEDNPGKVKESYLAEAMLPSEAESRVLDEIKPFVFGDCDVKSIKKRNFFDIFPNDGAEFWYEAKVEMITIDGDKDKRKAVTMLIAEDNIFGAVKELKFKLSNFDCEIISVKKTPILDIIKAS